jgi:hypothetical protein
VEERLPLLIQKLLEAQIRKNPPVFPWERNINRNDTIEPESGHTKPSIPSSPSPFIGERGEIS